MRQVSISKLKTMTAPRLRKLGSFEMVADGDHIGVCVIMAEPEMRNRIMVLGGQVDASRGLKATS